MRSCGRLEYGAMAIFHLQVNTVSRSAGRSATAAGAYRAGERIVDEQTGEIHDYTRKGGVEASALFAPADAPEWAADRARLWNAAEAAERRKNSTVAREFVVALPAELSAEDRQALAFDLGRALVARHGVAVDVCIHAPGKDGDERNHHAHVLMTTRRMTPEGLAEKSRELDNQRSGEVDHWRAEWAAMANRALERAGRAERIDHRTLEEQGIERMPTTHNGPAVTDMLRKGRQSDVADRQAEQAGQFDQAKREAAAAAVDLAKVQAMLDQAIEAAAHELAEQKRQAEAKRLEAMDSRRLLAEVARMREKLPSTEQLAAQDPQVQATRQRFQQVQEQQKVAQAKEQKAWREAQAWRKANPIRTWLHDHGLKSGRLRELNDAWIAAGDRVKVLEQAETQAHKESREAWHSAEVRANVELSPRRIEIEELHRRALERQKDERQQQRSQGKSAGLVEREFKALAAKRAVRANGYSDRSENWAENTPELLRRVVDKYNSEPKEVREIRLQKLLQDPKTMRELSGLMDERRQNIEQSNQLSR